MIPHPEAFQASITFSKKFRFQFTAGGVFDFTPVIMRNFLSISGYQVSSANASTYPLIDRFRIVQVELFGPMTASLVPVTVKLEYVSAGGSQLNSASKLYSDTSMSSSAAAHVKAVPEPESIAAMWIGTLNTQTLYTTTLPANGIMDVTLEIVLNDGGVPAPTSGIIPTAAAGTVGTVPPSGWISLGLPSL